MNLGIGAAFFVYNYFRDEAAKGLSNTLYG
jgi:hypothetical protein